MEMINGVTNGVEDRDLVDCANGDEMFVKKIITGDETWGYRGKSQIVTNFNFNTWFVIISRLKRDKIHSLRLYQTCTQTG